MRATTLAILGAALVSHHVRADVICVGIRKTLFMLESKGRTCVVALAGVTLPGTPGMTPAAFARHCGVKDDALVRFVAVVATGLAQYVGQPVTIAGTLGRTVWLTDADGANINCAVLRSGWGAVAPKPPEAYKDKLIGAQSKAARQNCGLWGLPMRSDPSMDITVKYAARTDDVTADDKSRSYGSFRTSDKTFEKTRVIDLTLDASSLKRPLAITVHYQFKTVTFEGGYGKNDGRDLATTPIKVNTILLEPGDVKKVALKSDTVKMNRHFDSDGSRWTYKQGTDFAGDIVRVFYREHTLFSNGTLVGTPPAAEDVDDSDAADEEGATDAAADE